MNDLFGTPAPAGTYTCTATLYDKACLTAGATQQQTCEITGNGTLGEISYGNGVVAKSENHTGTIYLPSEKEMTATIPIGNVTQQALSFAGAEITKGESSHITINANNTNIDTSNSNLTLKFNIKSNAEPNDNNQWLGEEFKLNIKVNKDSNQLFAERTYTFTCNTKPTYKVAIQPIEDVGFKLELSNNQTVNIHEDLKHGYIKYTVTPPSGSNLSKKEEKIQCSEFSSPNYEKELKLSELFRTTTPSPLHYMIKQV